MKIKKILLLIAPAYTFKYFRDIDPLPPLGLGYLAAAVKDLGVAVEILDCLVLGWNHEEEVAGNLVRVGLPNSEIETYIRQFDPDLIGINCQFSRQYKIYHELFALAKKVKPQCITMGGGAHVTVCPEEVLQDPSCDYVLLGEAENSFKDFITKVNQGADLTASDGFGYKSNGRIYVNKKTRWITDLDSIPYPAYDMIDLPKYAGLQTAHGLRHKDRFCPIVTSRGCPAKCTFCSACQVWGNRYRMRSVENVIGEMRLLKEKYNVEELMFEDDNVTAHPKRAKELFSRMIENRFNFTWDTPNGVGVWSLDEETLDLIKKSGCVKLNFAVESGSQEVLTKIVKKPLNLARVKKLIAHCKNIGLDYGMFLVVGLPGEKISDMWKSISYAVECGCYDPHISIATPYPGTELFSVCKEKGYFVREFKYEDLFIKSYMLQTPDWDEKKLQKFMSQVTVYLKIRRFLARPGLLIDWTIKSFKNPKKLYNYVANLIRPLL